MRNEPELVAYIRRTWDVEVQATTFNGSLWDAIDRMHRTTVFVGMHVRARPGRGEECHVY